MSTTTVSKPARTAGSNDHSNRSAGRSAGMTIVVTGLLVIVALYFIVPVYWVLVAASKTSEDLRVLVRPELRAMGEPDPGRHL